MKRILCLAIITAAAVGRADWTPPDKPDPSKILEEARADGDAGRFSDALAKRVWFHENALKYNQGLYGVRLSFALSDWAKLGEVYPPALEKLKNVRDQISQEAHEGRISDDAFADFIALNKTLKEESKTKDLFVWLDSTNSAAAKEVFHLAEPALIRAKEYRMCGKYLDPDASLHSAVTAFQETRQIAKDPKFGKKLQDFAEKSFSNSTTTLVALLVLNDRKDDAVRIAAAAAKEWDDPNFKKQLEEAKTGKVPEPWP
jgi:hypothetical protein